MKSRNPRLLNLRDQPFPVFILLVLFAAATLPARAQETVVSFDPAQSKVEFTLDSTLHTVHGTFKLKNGTVKFDPTTGKASGAIVVDATSGESGNDGRDKKMHKEIIESGKFPEIVFTPKEIQGGNLSGQSQVTVTGTLNLHGHDHEMTLSIIAARGAGGQFLADTHFSVPYVKWGLKSPSTFLLHASDTVDLDIHTAGQISGGAAATR
jgi:polyisoprenoid-binding protein YceI